MMQVSVTRRALVGGVAAALAARAVGLAPAVAETAVRTTADVVVHPPMWAAGTPGDYNWHAFEALDAQDAFAQWCNYRGIPVGERPAFDHECAMRVPLWDGIPPYALSPADWVDGGLGHFCQRCDSETAHDCGGGTVNGEVVCEDCMGYVDHLDRDAEYGYERLVELIAVEGPEKARAKIEKDEDFDMIPVETWAKAVTEAATLV